MEVSHGVVIQSRSSFALAVRSVFNSSYGGFIYDIDFNQGWKG